VAQDYQAKAARKIFHQNSWIHNGKIHLNILNYLIKREAGKQAEWTL
jgi:hypothetical protein